MVSLQTHGDGKDSNKTLTNGTKTKAAKKKKPVLSDSEDDYMPDIEEVLSGGAGDAGGGGKKKLSVERIYQKKTQLEHILLRPDTYIGSVEKVTQVRAVISVMTQCSFCVSAWVMVCEFCV